MESASTYTSHPVFTLTVSSTPATPHGPINQRTFLTSLGLAPRLDRLLQSAPTKERKIEIANAARRLVDEDGMGGEYQFLGITPRAAGEGSEEEQVRVYPFEVAR
jgi:NADH dehydrogenase [ubiquinone] 1 alpha subcomplex assembly factor 7